LLVAIVTTVSTIKFNPSYSPDGASVVFFFFLSRGSRTVGASYEIPPRRAILCMVWRLL